MSAAEALTPEEHIARVKADAEKLAESLGAAADSGVGPATLMPVLMQVFKASGLKLP